MTDPYARLEALRRTAAVDLVGEPERITSHSNDTWYARSAADGDVVVRVCWIGDRDRLLREAAVGRAAPAEVGYPEVLGSGGLTVAGEPITWMVTRRLSGTTLRAVWPDLDETQRDRALRDAVRPLRALHGWRPPAPVADHLTAPAPSDDAMTVVGRTIVPLPLDRVRPLIGPALDRAPEHRDTIEAAWRRLDDRPELLPRLDDPRDVVTHGDLHLDNIWWDGRRVSGLLDLEWVRWGPAWVDLVSVQDNVLADVEGSAAHARLLAVLREELPELATPSVDRQVTAVLLAFQLRQLLVWPAPGPDPAPDHPVALLARLLELS